MRQELKSKALSVIRDKFNPKSVLVPLPKQAAAKALVYRSELSPVSIHLAQQSYDDMCTANYKAEFDKHKGRLEKESKRALLKLGKHQIEQNRLLQTLRADKKYIDSDPLDEFPEHKRLEFMEIF
jgi:hypothetical protein